MRKIREIMRLKWEAHLSIRAIGRSCGITHSSVSDILRRAEAAGLTWPLPDDLDHLLYSTTVSTESRPLPDVNYIHQELKKKSVTLQLLWQEYKQEHPDGLQYGQFC